ncbi:hypothetical protein [Bartonella sp. B17]
MNNYSHYGMKQSLALSLAVHAILLGLGAVHLTNPISLQQQQLEAISVTLAPLEQEISFQQGVFNAPVHAVSAVKPTTKPQKKEEAYHFGDGQVDSSAPLKLKEKPRDVEVASAPSGEERALETNTETLPEVPQEEMQEIAPEPSSAAPLEEMQEVTPEPSSAAPSEEMQEVTPEPSSAAPSEEMQEIAPESSSAAPLEEMQEIAPEPSSAAPLEEMQEIAPEPSSAAPLEEMQEIAPEPSSAAPSEEMQEIAPESSSAAPLEEMQEVTPEPSSAAPLEIFQETTPEAFPKVQSEVPTPVLKDKKIISPQKAISSVQEVSEGQAASAHQQAEKIVLPEKFPYPQFKPKSIKQLAAKNTQTAKKQNQQKAGQTIEDILEIEEKSLLNHARTQGGGAKRSSKPEAFGGRKDIGNTEKMAQTLVNIAGACIQKKLKLVALGGDLKNRPIVRLRFYLNHEGMVVGNPIIDPLSGAKSQQDIMMRQVYAAVFACQPYTDLPRDQYDLWGQGFDFNVDPLQE